MEVYVRKNQFGYTIEALVCAFLEENQLTCVQRNFSCRLGEIDLIMLDASSNTLVFVEVRFRARASHGSATESVDWRKQRKLRRAVMHYLQIHADARRAARVDVVGVSYISQSAHSIDFHLPSVSIHQFQEYQLVWTRNALDDN